jgi:hypothetical protein
LETVLSQFRDNVKSVFELADFDHFVLDIALKRLRTVEDRIQRKLHTENERYSLAPAIAHLESFRTNDSTRIRYESMFNQCIVLLVSYFESASRQIFRESLINVLAGDDPPVKLMTERLSFTVEELAESQNEGISQLAEFFIRKKDPSFTDMKSIRDAFNNYLGIDPGRDELTNTVIFAQAARHAIVHAGATADERFVNQIRDASPRRLRPNVSLNTRLVFSEEEITVLGEAMVEFVGRLVPVGT